MELFVRDSPCRRTTWRNRWHCDSPHPKGSPCRSETHTLSADVELSFGIIRLRTLLTCNCTNASRAATIVGQNESVSPSARRRPGRRVPAGDAPAVAVPTWLHVPPVPSPPPPPPPPESDDLKATRRPRRAEGSPLRATCAFKRSSPPGSEAAPSPRAAFPCITFFVYGASLASSPATRASSTPLASEAVEEEDDEVPDVVEDAPHFFDWKMQSAVLLRGVV
jgi:hypothetical protein